MEVFEKGEGRAEKVRGGGRRREREKTSLNNGIHFAVALAEKHLINLVEHVR